MCVRFELLVDRLSEAASLAATTELLQSLMGRGVAHQSVIGSQLQQSLK